MSNSEGKLSPRFFPASVLMWSRTVAQFLEAVARRGFQGGEVWAQHLQRTGESVREVRRKADELGLELTAHAVSYDLNPLSHNPEIRAVSRRQVLESMALAASLRARVIVVHPGHLSSGTDDPEYYWPDLLDFCAALDEHAELLGLKVGVEGMERKVNQFLIEPSVLNRLGHEMQQAAWERLGLTVDMAHLATFSDPLTTFAEIERVVHIHLSDGDPPVATHRPMGLGRLPVGEMVAAAMKSGVPTIAIEGRWRQDEELPLDRAAAELKTYTAA